MWGAAALSAGPADAASECGGAGASWYGGPEDLETRPRLRMRGDTGEECTLKRLCVALIRTHAQEFTADDLLQGVPLDLCQEIINSMTDVLTYQNLLQLAGCPLTSLSFRNCGRVNDRWCSYFSTFGISSLSLAGCIHISDKGLQQLLNTRRLHKHRGVEVECPPSPADILFQEEEEKPGLLDGDTPSLGEDGIFSSTISAVAEDSCLSTPSPSGVTPPASIVRSKRRMGGSASSSADSSPLWMSHQSPSAFSTHFPPAFSLEDGYSSGDRSQLRRVSSENHLESGSNLRPGGSSTPRDVRNSPSASPVAAASFQFLSSSPLEFNPPSLPAFMLTSSALQAPPETPPVAGFRHSIPLRDTLQSLNLCNCPLVSNNGMRHVAHLSNLTSLDLEGCLNVGKSGLEVISKSLHGLTSLSLRRNARLNEQALEPLSALAPSLRSLNLAMCSKVDDKASRVLSHLTNLTMLNVFRCSKLTDRHFPANLGSLAKLEYLDIGECRHLGCSTLISLCTNHPALRTLIMPCISIEDAGFASVWKLERLEHLNIRGNKFVSPDALSCIRHLASLTHLNLCDTNVDDMLISDLLGEDEDVGLPQLRVLNLSMCEHLGGETFLEELMLRPRPNLEILKVDENPDTPDEAWRHLLGLPNLKVFCASNAHLLGGETFHEMSVQLALLEVLDIPSCEGLSATCLHSIQNFSHLRALDLSHSNVDNSVLEALVRSESRLLLKTLCLAECNAIKNEGINILPRLENLTSLLLDGCLGIHSDGFHPLAKMPSLRDLSLRHTNLNDDGGSFLGSLRLLRALHLEGCTDLTDEILVYLEPLRELTYLNLSFCNISDLGLHLLEDMHMNLQALRVSGCPGITEAGLDVALRMENLSSIKCRKLD